jgi:hypothetical protein
MNSKRAQSDRFAHARKIEFVSQKSAGAALLPVLLWRLPKATRETSAKHFSNSCGKVVNIDHPG